MFEYRIHGAGYRVYFGQDGETLVILLTGGTKSASSATSMRRRPVGGLQAAQGRHDNGGGNGNDTKLQGTGAEAASSAIRHSREALLREGIDAMLAGDVDTGKAILRDYIKATVGFEKLGEATGTQPKSLIRMFGPRGNPQARNLFSVLGYLQKQAGVELHVAPGPA